MGPATGTILGILEIATPSQMRGPATAGF
jgi:hypothetical protein